MNREAAVDRLYDLLADLERRLGGYRRLSDCDGYMDWPERGVYFFFAADETRADDDLPRVTRVGTHAVSGDSGASLWNRLRDHRGTFSGNHADGGNHRGSVFRLRVGEAFVRRDGLQSEYPYWGEGSSAPADGVRDEEHPMEQRVSDYIRNLPLLWLEVDDEPGPDSDRAYLERNAIALLSNVDDDAIDARDDGWLGAHSASSRIRNSGLWNVDHVDESFDPAFLDRLEQYVRGMDRV